MIERLASKLYYGWIMILVGFLIVTITYGCRLSFGTLFGSLLDEFGWSRAMVTSVFSVSLLAQALLQPLAGALLDKFGSRKMIKAGAILLAISFVLFGRAHGLVSIYISYGILFSLATIAMGIVVNTTMISYWFIKNRGIATGTIVIGTSLGIFIFNPLLAFLINNYGWRTSVTILGLAAGTLIFALITILGRDKPADIGQNIDGISDEEMGQILSAKNNPSLETKYHKRDLTFKQALSTRDFWLFMIIYVGDLFSWFSITNHSVIAMTDSGLDRFTAASIFGYIGLLAIVSGLFFSWLSDILGERKLILASGFLLSGIAILMFSKGTNNVHYLYVVILILGIGHGAVALLPATVADRFGVESMGKIWGTITTAGLVGGAIGPIVTGYLYDITRSYSLSWQISAIAVFTSMVCVLLVQRKNGVKKVS